MGIKLCTIKFSGFSKLGTCKQNIRKHLSSLRKKCFKLTRYKKTPIIVTSQYNCLGKNLGYVMRKALIFSVWSCRLYAMEFLYNYSKFLLRNLRYLFLIHSNHTNFILEVNLIFLVLIATHERLQRAKSGGLDSFDT